MEYRDSARIDTSDVRRGGGSGRRGGGMRGGGGMRPRGGRMAIGGVGGVVVLVLVLLFGNSLGVNVNDLL